MKYLNLILLTFLINSSISLYCKPYCSSNTACSGTYDSCTVGCQTPYNHDSPGCSLNTTLNTLITSQLPSDSSFTPSGYISNSASALSGSTSCTDGNTYHMVGPLGVSQYIYKQFSGLGTNHFQIDIFWSYGIFGGWAGQALSAVFIDSNGVVSMQANQGQTCGSTTALSGCTGTIGCFNNKQQTISHNTDTISVNFTSDGSAMTSALTWAVNNLYIVVSICHSNCLTCTASTAYDCLSCQPGLFLRGSTCVRQCPLYTMADTGVCTSACPIDYFLNTYNNFCQQCPQNCQACSSSSDCYQWDEGSEQYFILIELLPLWITLAILLFVILALITWKCCCSSKTFYDQMQEQIIDHRNQSKKESKYERQRQVRERVKDGNQSYETMQQRWLNDLDDLHNTRGSMKKNSVIQGIGKNTIN